MTKKNFKSFFVIILMILFSYSSYIRADSIDNHIQPGLFWTCMPTSEISGTNSFSFDGTYYHFVYTGTDCIITYFVPKSGGLNGIVANFNNIYQFQPSNGSSGMTWTTVTSWDSANGILKLNSNQFDVRILQKTLAITWSGANNTINCGYLTPGSDQEGQVFWFPYNTYSSYAMLRKKSTSDNYCFVSNFLDWTYSRGDGTYHSVPAPLGNWPNSGQPWTTGNIYYSNWSANTTQERMYVTIGTKVEDIMSNIPFSPSPCLDSLSTKFVYDDWCSISSVNPLN